MFFFLNLSWYTNILCIVYTLYTPKHCLGRTINQKWFRCPKRSFGINLGHHVLTIVRCGRQSRTKILLNLLLHTHKHTHTQKPGHTYSSTILYGQVKKLFLPNDAYLLIKMFKTVKSAPTEVNRVHLCKMRSISVRCQ